MLLNNKQVKEKLGKYGFFFGVVGKFICDMHYVGGLKELDKLIEERKGFDLVSFEIKPKGLDIAFPSFPDPTLRLGIPFEDFLNWSIENQDEILTKKSKSIIGRALIGGILFGPVGAIVGGMTGIGDKVINNALIENVISIYFEMEGEKQVLFLSTKNKHVSKIHNFLTSYFPEKYVKPEIFIELQNKNNNKFSLSDEIVELKIVE